MTLQVCLEFFRYGEGSTKVITSLTSLIDQILNGTKILYEILQSNIDLMTTDPSRWNGNVVTYFQENIEWKCRGVHLVQADQNQYEVHKDAVAHFTQQTLPGVILYQKNVELDVRQGNFANRAFVYDLDWERPYNQMTIARAFEGLECPDCGQIQSTASIRSHQQSLRCLQATGERGLREAGWKQVEQSHHGAAIRKAGIEWDIRAVEYKMWIPAWVDAAIRQYESNSGYSGLKLEDFLAKMRPEKAKI